jgi:aspartate/glutamate racemase
MLAGTDLALVFKKTQDLGFEIFDCAQVHAEAIVQAVMTNSKHASYR